MSHPPIVDVHGLNKRFGTRHVVKDLSLAIEEAQDLGLDLPVLKAARDRWLQLTQQHPQARAVHEVARLYS